jgi:hypothetical protein
MVKTGFLAKIPLLPIQLIPKYAKRRSIVGSFELSHNVLELDALAPSSSLLIFFC